MLKKKQIAVILTVLFFACSCLAGILKLMSDNKKDCHLRNTVIPEAPLVPDSVLLEEDVIIDADVVTSLKRRYQVTENLQDVIVYFQSHATNCWLFDTRFSCDGDASPFGYYEIDVSLSGQTTTTTTYLVYLEWRKCPQDDQVDTWFGPK